MILLMLLLTGTSCRKCQTCSRMCYKCYYANNPTYPDTICGGGSITGQILNAQIQAMQQQGYICTQFNSGAQYQYCDGNSNLTTYIQNTGLLCQ